MLQDFFFCFYLVSMKSLHASNSIKKEIKKKILFKIVTPQGIRNFEWIFRKKSLLILSLHPYLHLLSIAHCARIGNYGQKGSTAHL